MQLSLFTDSSDNYEDIILSLQEVYFNKILNGEKKYEYRFNFCKGKSKAYVYLPKNKQQIAGVLYLGTPMLMTKKDTCDLYVKCGDGEYAVMDDWIGDRKDCYVIPIEKAIRFDNPIKKEELKKYEEFLAPQTYLLLKNRLVLKDFLNNYEKQKGNEYVR